MDRKPKTAAAPRRFGKGFRHASETVRKSLGQIVGKKGFAESDVLLRWPEIIGEALARTCQPVKVHYGAKRDLGATLVVQTDSGRAPEVSHLAPKLVERVNRFYGYRAISRIKVTQSTGYASPGAARTGYQQRGFSEAQAGFDTADAPTRSRVAREAADLTAGIENEDLRNALTLMGRHVLSTRNNSDPN